VLPDKSVTTTGQFTVNALHPGTYSLRIGVINPRTGQPGVSLQTVNNDASLRYIMGDISLTQDGLIFGLSRNTSNPHD
jgi:hypothetical protein